MRVIFPSEFLDQKSPFSLTKKFANAKDKYVDSFNHPHCTSGLGENFLDGIICQKF